MNRILRSFQRGSEESSVTFLQRKYLKILRKDYRVRPQMVSDQLLPVLPSFTSLAEAQDYIAKHMHDFAAGRKIFNGYWNRLLRDALHAMPRATGLHDAGIFIGEVPDPTFNSGVHDFGDERYLILVQTGLELFLYRVSLAIVGSMRLRVGAAEEKQIVVEPELDMAAARSIVRRNVESLFHGKHEMPVALKSELALGVAVNCAYALQQFVIAHEIGHIAQSVRPYSDEAGTSRKPPLSAVSDYLKHPWNKEFVADHFASIICEGLVSTVTANGDMSQDIAERVLFEAPYIIFPLMESLDKFAAAHGVKGWTHPPASLRRSKLLSLQTTRGLPEYYRDLANERAGHITQLTNGDDTTPSEPPAA